jgi:hypothetical protein
VCGRGCGQGSLKCGLGSAWLNLSESGTAHIPAEDYLRAWPARFTDHLSDLSSAQSSIPHHIKFAAPCLISAMDLVCLQCCLESIVRSPSPALIDALLLTRVQKACLGALAPQSTLRYIKERHLLFESLLTFSIIVSRLKVFHFILTKA